MSGTAKNGRRLVTSPVRWGAMAFSSLTNERRWWFMIEKILEVVFWSLKLLSAALDLFSAMKKSRHAKPKHWVGLFFHSCEVTTVYRQCHFIVILIMKNISVNTLIYDILFVYQQTSREMLTLYGYILSIVNWVGRFIIWR